MCKTNERFPIETDSAARLSNPEQIEEDKNCACPGGEYKDG